MDIQHALISLHSYIFRKTWGTNTATKGTLPLKLKRVSEISCRSAVEDGKYYLNVHDVNLFFNPANPPTTTKWFVFVLSRQTYRGYGFDLPVDYLDKIPTALLDGNQIRTHLLSDSSGKFIDVSKCYFKLSGDNTDTTSDTLLIAVPDTEITCDEYQTRSYHFNIMLTKDELLTDVSTTTSPVNNILVDGVYYTSSQNVNSEYATANSVLQLIGDSETFQVATCPFVINDNFAKSYLFASTLDNKDGELLTNTKLSHIFVHGSDPSVPGVYISPALVNFRLNLTTIDFTIDRNLLSEYVTMFGSDLKLTIVKSVTEAGTSGIIDDKLINELAKLPRSERISYLQGSSLESNPMCIWSAGKLLKSEYCSIIEAGSPQVLAKYTDLPQYVNLLGVQHVTYILSKWIDSFTYPNTSFIVCPGISDNLSLLLYDDTGVRIPTDEYDFTVSEDGYVLTVDFVPSYVSGMADGTRFTYELIPGEKAGVVIVQPGTQYTERLTEDYLLTRYDELTGAWEDITDHLEDYVEHTELGGLPYLKLLNINHLYTVHFGEGVVSGSYGNSSGLIRPYANFTGKQHFEYPTPVDQLDELSAVLTCTTPVLGTGYPVQHRNAKLIFNNEDANGAWVDLGNLDRVSEYTVELYFTPLSHKQNANIFCGGTDLTLHKLQYDALTNDLKFGPQVTGDGWGPLLPGVKHKITLTNDGSTLRLYVNSTLRTSVAYMGGNYGNFYLGTPDSQLPTDLALLGEFEDIAIFSRAFSTPEVSNRVNTVVNVGDTNLIRLFTGDHTGEIVTELVAGEHGDMHGFVNSSELTYQYTTRHHPLVNDATSNVYVELVENYDVHDVLDTLEVVVHAGENSVSSVIDSTPDKWINVGMSYSRSMAELSLIVSGQVITTLSALTLAPFATIDRLLGSTYNHDGNMIHYVGKTTVLGTWETKLTAVELTEFADNLTVPVGGNVYNFDGSPIADLVYTNMANFWQLGETMYVSSYTGSRLIPLTTAVDKVDQGGNGIIIPEYSGAASDIDILGELTGVKEQVQVDATGTSEYIPNDAFNFNIQLIGHAGASPYARLYPNKDNWIDDNHFVVGLHTDRTDGSIRAQRFIIYNVNYELDANGDVINNTVDIVSTSPIDAVVEAAQTYRGYVYRDGYILARTYYGIEVYSVDVDNGYTITLVHREPLAGPINHNDRTGLEFITGTNLLISNVRAGQDHVLRYNPNSATPSGILTVEHAIGTAGLFIYWGIDTYQSTVYKVYGTTVQLYDINPSAGYPNGKSLGVAVSIPGGTIDRLAFESNRVHALDLDGYIRQYRPNTAGDALELVHTQRVITANIADPVRPMLDVSSADTLMFAANGMSPSTIVWDEEAWTYTKHDHSSLTDWTQMSHPSTRRISRTSALYMGCSSTVGGPIDVYHISWDAPVYQQVTNVTKLMSTDPHPTCMETCGYTLETSEALVYKTPMYLKIRRYVVVGIEISYAHAAGFRTDTKNSYGRDIQDIRLSTTTLALTADMDIATITSEFYESHIPNKVIYSNGEVEELDFKNTHDNTILLKASPKMFNAYDEVELRFDNDAHRVRLAKVRVILAERDSVASNAIIRGVDYPLSNQYVVLHHGGLRVAPTQYTIENLSLGSNNISAIVINDDSAIGGTEIPIEYTIYRKPFIKTRVDQYIGNTLQSPPPVGGQTETAVLQNEYRLTMLDDGVVLSGTAASLFTTQGGLLELAGVTVGNEIGFNLIFDDMVTLTSITVSNIANQLVESNCSFDIRLYDSVNFVVGLIERDAKITREVTFTDFYVPDSDGDSTSRYRKSCDVKMIRFVKKCTALDDMRLTIAGIKLIKLLPIGTAVNPDNNVFESFATKIINGRVNPSNYVLPDDREEYLITSYGTTAFNQLEPKLYEGVVDSMTTFKLRR